MTNFLSFEYATTDDDLLYRKQFPLWIEKYAPGSIEDLKINSEIICNIRSYLDQNYLPHLLFYGPSGAGKTTLTKFIIKEYLGPQFVNYAKLEVNGSIHKGKNIISELPKKNYEKNNYPNVTLFIRKRLGKRFEDSKKFKLIVIYDFDNMSVEAQNSLRATMEKYNGTARFIFVCNDLNKIIEPIQSRTIILSFASINKQAIHDKLAAIGQQEQLNIDDEILLKIAELSEGDIKVAINVFQTFSECETKTLNSFSYIFNLPPQPLIWSLISDCYNGCLNGALESVKKLLDNGFSVPDILDILMKAVLKNKFDGNNDMVTDTRIRLNFIRNITDCYLANETHQSKYNLFGLITSMYESARV